MWCVISSTWAAFAADYDGNPLQYSCLENPMGGGAWWAAVHGVAELDPTEQLHFHFHALEKEMAIHPRQCSCLENPRDGGAWWAAVSGVAQSRTRLKQLSSSSSSSMMHNQSLDSTVAYNQCDYNARICLVWWREEVSMQGVFFVCFFVFFFFFFW